MSNPKVSVDTDKPSYYHSPKVDSPKEKLHRLRMQLSFNQYKSIVRKYTNVSLNTDSQILEIGSGPGYLLSFLESWFPKSSICGLEYDSRLVAEAKQRTTRTNFVQGNAEELSFSDEQFDAIISLHLIEHLYHPEQMLAEVKRTLKKDGIFILATPNLGGIGAKMMGEKWHGFRDDHVSLKSADEWSHLIEQSGFTLLKRSTTLFTGIPLLRIPPLGLINSALLLFFGSFPWNHGEAYIAVCRKNT
jgi:ubiquinone/menaquinone biosynthesis C-methylase UbiE